MLVTQSLLQTIRKLLTKKSALEKLTKSFKKRYNLTDPQADKITTLYLDYLAKAITEGQQIGGTVVPPCSNKFRSQIIKYPLSRVFYYCKYTYVTRLIRHLQLFH